MRKLKPTVLILIGSIIGGMISQPAIGYIKGAIAQTLTACALAAVCNFTGVDGTIQAAVGYMAGAAEYLTMQGGLTSQGGSIIATSTNTNVSVNLTAKGSGSILLGSGEGPLFAAISSAAVNSDGAVQATASPSGASGGLAAVILGNSHYGVTLNGGSNNYTAPMANMTPSSSSQTCTAGQMSWDATFLYWCKSANTWLRLTGATF